MLIYTGIMSKQGANYMAHLREFRNSKQEIYKIGGTERPVVERIRDYPKDTMLIVYANVLNHQESEQELIKIFDIKFINRPDIGREYYEGNKNDMINEFLFVTRKYQTISGENQVVNIIVKPSNILPIITNLPPLLKQGTLQNKIDNETVSNLKKNVYNCDCCDYKTETHQAIKKHVLSQKHITTAEEHSYVCDVENTITVYICGICHKEFKVLSTKRKHQQKCKLDNCKKLQINAPQQSQQSQQAQQPQQHQQVFPDANFLITNLSNQNKSLSDQNKLLLDQNKFLTEQIGILLQSQTNQITNQSNQICPIIKPKRKEDNSRYLNGTH